MKPINDHLTAAFRLAHRASESERFDLAARNVFRAIAHEIWQAHGRPADDELDPAAPAAPVETMQTIWLVKVFKDGKEYRTETFETRGKASAYAMRWNKAQDRYRAEVIRASAAAPAAEVR